MAWATALPTQPWNGPRVCNTMKHHQASSTMKIKELSEQVLEQSQDVLVVPLALLFSSTVLQDACEVFHCFLSWPEPCCSASRHLLSLIQQELRVPGI
uniref:phosphoinositide 3-kinase regulatory subunit 5-like n=1 Tax=Oncorhynchus gorbuscha TaxID=8017 RepID=UPI001EAEDD12|nr:phosphoinositide 3-kinase regulatory subunit 5-like [Oncorhynchus gorbuscha]XP_046187476.1 phosphoinositide 3-kinase regulatory subunit 5-like [Oncorhynchus gorbuscha]